MQLRPDENIVNNSYRYGKHLWVAAFLIVYFTGANSAAADVVGSEWATDDGGLGLPPSQMSGWFFNGNSDGLFPAATDPSQPWTSAENLATLNAWASLVAAADGDPALLAQLIGLGMTGSTGQAAFEASLVTSQQQTGEAPEPMLLGLLGGGAALLGFYAASRMRRMR